MKYFYRIYFSGVGPKKQSISEIILNAAYSRFSPAVPGWVQIKVP